MGITLLPLSLSIQFVLSKRLVDPRDDDFKDDFRRTSCSDESESELLLRRSVVVSLDADVVRTVTSRCRLSRSVGRPIITPLRFLYSFMIGEGVVVGVVVAGVCGGGSSSPCPPSQYPSGSWTCCTLLAGSSME